MLASESQPGLFDPFLHEYLAENEPLARPLLVRNRPQLVQDEVLLERTKHGAVKEQIAQELVVGEICNCLITTLKHVGKFRLVDWQLPNLRRKTRSHSRNG